VTEGERREERGSKEGEKGPGEESDQQ